MPRVFISDSTSAPGHGATIRDAVLANHPGLVSADITLQLNASYTLAGVLADMATAYAGGYELFIHCTTIAKQLTSYAYSYWQQGQTMRVVTPLGSNDHEAVPYSPDIRGVMVTCGASDGAYNETGYGNALWFFDDDNDALPSDLSSYSTGVIAGKLLYIKDQRGCSWWEAIYAAAQTASEGGTPTLNNGYGRIDVAAAIAWQGVVPFDPYLPIGTVGTLSGSATGAAASITAAAVTNATEYYLERNIGSGWEVIDVSPTRTFSKTLAPNVSTQYRYRAGNGGGVTGYSNTITLEYVDQVAIKRQQIVDAIKARMEGMTTGGGYSLNYAGKVHVWRKTAFDKAEVTAGALNIIHSNPRPDTERPEAMSGPTNRWHRRLRVDIDIPANGDLTIEKVVERETDVEAAIGSDLTWGGLAIDTVWLENTEEKMHEEDAVAKGRVSFEVIYSTDQWSED